MRYVSVMDLLFNGASGCKLLDRPPKAPYIRIEDRFDMGVGTTVYTYWFRNIYLGRTHGAITIGGLNAILQGLRGMGVWKCWNWIDRERYEPFTPEEEAQVRQIGIWAY